MASSVKEAATKLACKDTFLASRLSVNGQRTLISSQCYPSVLCRKGKEPTRHHLPYKPMPVSPLITHVLLSQQCDLVRRPTLLSVHPAVMCPYWTGCNGHLRSDVQSLDKAQCDAMLRGRMSF